MSLVLLCVSISVLGGGWRCSLARCWRVDHSIGPATCSLSSNRLQCCLLLSILRSWFVLGRRSVRSDHCCLRVLVLAGSWLACSDGAGLRCWPGFSCRYVHRGRGSTVLLLIPISLKPTRADGSHLVDLKRCGGRFKARLTFKRKKHLPLKGWIHKQ